MTEKREFLERVKTLRLRDNGNLHKAQVRSKRNYDLGSNPRTLTCKRETKPTCE
jgi:hypothetical protein